MANNFVISQKVDLNKGIDGFVVWPHALLIEGDNLAHTWEVDVYQDGKPATLDGMTAKGYFVRSDGSTVDATGSVSGNKVSVTFPSPAYAYEGDLQAIIRLTNTDGSLITLSAMLFRVVSVLTDRIVDPENVIPSLEELLDKIEKLEQATTAANAATSKANTAASEAEKRVDTAVKSANDATSAANAAAGRVDTSITNANKAADRANTAAQIVDDLQVGDLDIGSIATKTYVNEQIDGIEIGGRNLIINSDRTLSNVTTATPNTTWKNTIYNFSEYGAAVINRLHYNDIITYSFEAIADENISVAVSLRDSNMAALYTNYSYNVISTDWASFSGILKINSDLPKIGTIVFSTAPQHAEYSYSIRRVKVELGNKSTDWTPAPEDIDRAISRRASATYDYGGRNLKDVFGTVEAMRAALVAEDYTNIAVGDYWPITLNGTFRDYGSYTVPVGTDVYSDVNCQMKYGTVGGPHEGSFASDTAVLTSDSLEATIYAKTSDCLPYFERTCNNVTVKLEVAGINHYWRYGESGDLVSKPHIVFISRDCLPFILRMRKGSTKWEDETAQNPWLGSALYKTLNDDTNGILSLVAKTDIGNSIYAGPNNKGMRALLERKEQNNGNSTGYAWRDRGKLFLPSASETWGSPFFADMNYDGGLGNQFAIFRGSGRHIVKGSGDLGGRTGWWLSSSRAGNTTNFVFITGTGNVGDFNAANQFNTIVCFIFI